MVYTPPFTKQLDGSPYGGTNCTVAATCMAAIRHRRGSNPPGDAPWYPYPSWVRIVMRDYSGGTNLAQNRNVFLAHYGINFEIRYKLAWSMFRSKIKAGSGAVLQGAYKVVLPTKFDGSGTFTGNHAIYVNNVRFNNFKRVYEYQVADPLADGRRVGIPRGYQWWPEWLLKQFAGDLWLGSSRLGVGYVYAMFTRDTEVEPVVRLRFGGITIRSRDIYPRFDVGQGVYSNPYGTGTLVRRVPSGKLIFRRYQFARTDAEVNGTNTWFGNMTGTEWVPYGRVRFTP